MMNFKIVKKGYSQIEVDEYLARLINDYETRLSEQKDRIFYLKDELEKITKSSDKELMSSLVSAVERAKLIENSSKNIYELETKKLSLIYNKMENLLNENKDGEVVRREMQKLIEDCRKSLQNNIIKQNENIKESSVADPVRKLLEKMINQGGGHTDGSSNNFASNKKNVEKALLEKSDLEERKDFKLEKPKQEVVVETQIQPKQEIKIEKRLEVNSEVKPNSTEQKELDKSKVAKNDKKADTISRDNSQNFNKPVHVTAKLDEGSHLKTSSKKTNNSSAGYGYSSFLSDDDSSFNGNNFANIMFEKPKKKHENSNFITKQDIGDYTPNESGFDLKEAVNPKEDLEDIMKAFDFYNDDRKKK